MTACTRFMFFFSSRRRHTRCLSYWSSDVFSSDLLLQFRQLDIPTVICLFQYALVLQRLAHSVVTHQQAEDRALAHQWMAILRQVQRPYGFGRTVSVGAEGMV